MEPGKAGRDAVCIAFIANETLSIIENAGRMGVPLPERLRKSIDILRENGQEIKEDKEEV